MKKLKLNLKGAKALNKAEQRQINGGYGEGDCGDGETACSSGKIHCCCETVFKGCMTATQCINGC